jgi:hypothetical protein
MGAIGPVLLVVSVAARLAWTYLAPNGANFVDLHVYVGGAAMLDHPGSLYHYVYADQTPDFPLPFTYPPFAAVIFYPLHLLPFGLVAFCWTVGTMAALYGVVRISQRLLGVGAGEGHRLAMLWTGIAIWLEPLRSTFDYGQINVVLALATLAAVFSTRWWLSGLLLGTAAGVKLTPAIGGLYFVGARRWGTAVFSGVVFLGCRRSNSLLLHRIDLQDRPGRTDLHDLQPVLAGWYLPDLRPRRRLQPGGSGRDRCHRNTFRARLARSERPFGRTTRPTADRRTIRAVALADFLDASLGVAGAVDDLAATRPALRPSWRTHSRLDVAGAHHHRRALAAELRPADHLAERQTVVSSLGRAGLHRRVARDAGLDRGQRKARG